MEKSDLKTGMNIYFKDGCKSTVLLGTENGDIVAGETWFSLSSRPEKIIDWEDHNCVKTITNPISNNAYLTYHDNEYSERIIWERPKENSTCMIDGLEYSESTLRSIIKKANSI